MNVKGFVDKYAVYIGIALAIIGIVLGVLALMERKEVAGETN